MINKDLIRILQKLPKDAIVDLIEPDGTYFSRIYKIRYDEQPGYNNIPTIKKIHLSLEPVWQGEEHINNNDLWINPDITVPLHCYTCDKYNHLKDECKDGRILDPYCRFFTGINAIK